MDIRKSKTLFKARKQLRAALELLPADQIPVVALSGGADSLALAFTAKFEGVKHAHIIDHGLQTETAVVAQEMKKLVESWGMTCQITRVAVDCSNGGTENAARDARYAALLSNPAHSILVAHTMRDQAETVLMGFGRGSGARSIQGMAPSSQQGRIIRPFLSMKREEMETICEEFNLFYWNDPHNQHDEYRRVRVRKELLPLMEEIMGGGIEEALSRTAAMLREDNEFIDNCAEESYSLEAYELSLLDTAVRRRVIRMFLVDSGIDTSKLANVHVLAVDTLIMDWRGQKGVSVPGGIVKRSHNKLVFESV